MLYLSTLFVMVLGCSPAELTQPPSTPPLDSAPPQEEVSPADSAPPGDSEPPPALKEDSSSEDSGSEEGDSATPADRLDDLEVDESAWVFSHEQIHEIEISLSQRSIDSLSADPYSYVLAGVTISGEEVTEVGVRLRGKIGSFRDLSGKPKFKIDFNQFVEGQRFRGLETLGLNNEIVDYSYLKEPIGYRVFELAGSPTLRTGFARVTVNGALYGLYVLVEYPDDRWLRRHYEDPSGNLYDGKYIWYGDYNYTLLDFGTDVDELYQLEEGVDVNHEDIQAVSELYLSSRGQGSFYRDMQAVVNWEHLLPLMAAEQWTGQNDGYCMNRNNYRVYFNPLSETADLIPWDLDYSFLNDYDWGFSWSSPTGNLCRACLQDYECSQAWRAEVSSLLDAISGADLASEFTALQTLILETAMEDPRREAGWSTVVYYQEYIRDWLQTRESYMRSFWSL